MLSSSTPFRRWRYRIESGATCGSKLTHYQNVGDIGRQREYIDKAFALIDRVSPFERDFIAALYYNFNGELDKAIDAYRLANCSGPYHHRGRRGADCADPRFCRNAGIGNLTHWFEQWLQTPKPWVPSPGNLPRKYFAFC
jgi:hypothetical protein